MRPSTLSSLSAKLFYLMTILIVITVAGNSWQNSRFFQQYLSANLQDNLILKNKEVAQSISATLDSWQNQVKITVNSFQTGDGGRQIQNLLTANADLLGISLIRARSSQTSRELFSSFTSDRNAPGFDDQDPRSVQKTFHSLVAEVGENLRKVPNGSRAILIPVAERFKLPIMLVALPFRKMSDNSETIWALVLAWQSRITAPLPKTRTYEGLIIDQENKIYASPSGKASFEHKSLGDLALVKEASRSSTLFGFKGRYEDSKGREWLGSYVKIPEYGMTVLLQQDAKVATAATTKIVRRTTLWGIFFVLLAVLASFVASSGVTKNLRAVTQATYRIASGDFSTTLKSRGSDEVGMLSMAVTHMAKQIQVLMKSQMDKVRVEKELETARMVQSTFFPQDDGRSNIMTITGVYQPAAECGGDWWGHFRAPDGIEYVFIGDAMGHGVPAALVTAMAYSSCMTVSDILADRPGHKDSPAAIVKRFNRVLYDAVQGSISMTFFAAILDTKNGTMTYANAGHNFPVIIPTNADDPRAPSSRPMAKISPVPLISLQLKGMPLGIDRDAEYTEKTIDIAAGDKMIFFTDGLIECESPAGKQWGRKALLELLGSTCDKDAVEMKNGIMQSAYNFYGNVPIKDDITVVVLEMSKHWQAGMVVIDEPKPALNEEIAPSTEDATPMVQITAIGENPADDTPVLPEEIADAS